MPHTAKAIREEIDNEIDSVKPTLLILDFGEVTFMDSSGIGLVMGRFRKMQTTNGEIQIINTPIYISKVMRISGIEKLAKISPFQKELDELRAQHKAQFNK